MNSRTLLKIYEMPIYTQCKVCGKVLKGRTDKKYCNLQCKNLYHLHMRKINLKHTLQTDRFLHRNRIVLLELFENTHKKKLFTPKSLMLRMGFTFETYNGTYVNRQGKTYYYVYDFRWMQFSNQEVLVIKT